MKKKFRESFSQLIFKTNGENLVYQLILERIPYLLK